MSNRVDYPGRTSCGCPYLNQPDAAKHWRECHYRLNTERDARQTKSAPAQDEREAFNAEYDRICNGPLTVREIAWRTWQARAQREAPQVAGPYGLRIIFDGPPDHEAGRFVEVETADGCSVNAGIWRERPDGLWELAFYDEAPLLRERLRVQQEEIERLTRELIAALRSAHQGECDHYRCEPKEWHWSGQIRVMRCDDCGLEEYREDT